MIGSGVGGGGMLSFVFRLEFGGAAVRRVLPGEDFVLLMFAGDALFMFPGVVLLMFTGDTLLTLLGVLILVDVVGGTTWFCLLDFSDLNGMSFEFFDDDEGGVALIAALSVFISFSAVGAVGILLPPDTIAFRRGMLFI